MTIEHLFGATDPYLATDDNSVSGLDNAELTERFRQLELELRRAEVAAVINEVQRREVNTDDSHHSIELLLVQAEQLQFRDARLCLKRWRCSPRSTPHYAVAKRHPESSCSPKPQSEPL